MAAELQGIRVLITRTPMQSDELARLLQQRGASVRTIPLIRTGPPPNERELQAAVDAAENFAWLVFSSPNGVRSFSARRAAPLPAHVRVAAVGDATAEAVEEHLGTRDVLRPERFVAEALADTLLGHAAPGSSMLIVQAQDARPALAARLRSAGMHVRTVSGYTTIAAPPADLALRLKDCDVITLASASAVRALVEGLGGPERAALHVRGKLIACLGPVTGREARTRGLHVEIVPQDARVGALVDALCSYYSTQAD